MRIPLESGDEVVAASHIYANGLPVVIVVTRKGYVYELAYDGSRNDYVVNVL